MLDVGRECPACGAYLRTLSHEETHRCLPQGEVRYSVFYVRAADVDSEGVDDYERVLAAARSEDVNRHLRGVSDPENYRVYEWIGHGGEGTANDGESSWGDLWLEENG